MNIVKWYKNRSFQFKLVIGYLVLALIPMLCVTWYSYGKTRNVLLTEAYQSAEQEAERIRKKFFYDGRALRNNSGCAVCGSDAERIFVSGLQQRFL